MKVLSIKEPYATFIASGEKLIETRSWKTNYRGEIYIHASLGLSTALNKEKAMSYLKSDIKPGYILCRCNLVDCILMDEDFISYIETKTNEKDYGDYRLGRYAWELEIIEVLEMPISVKGRLGIWNYEDNYKLIDAMLSMRDLGNTLVVVEHDLDTMRRSDFLVDIGPLAGEQGGEVVACGTPEEVASCDNSITGNYLSGKKCIEVPKTRRKGSDKYLEIQGACENNLKNINVKFPLGTFTCVTGVSGSGKSTLVNEILYKKLTSEIYGSKVKPGKFKKIKGLEYVDKVVHISQDPIGRTPRSNPATYTGVFDDIRDLFATTKEAKMLGYDKSRFSFNVKGGRCEACRGDGVKKIEMHFLPDVYVPCEICHGKKYNSESLSIRFKDKNISEVLDMRVDEALEFFINFPKISHKLKTLHEVGLGYIKLGQSATTLSGGEASRVKLAKELQKKPTGKSIFIMDEPTTGLHNYDIENLLAIIKKIVDNKDTVIVIEHNLDMIKVADYIIDLGPEGGDKGGTVIATGTPEEITKVKESYTGQYLKKYL